MRNSDCPSCDEPVRFYAADRQAECPSCGEIIDVRGKRVKATRPARRRRPVEEEEFESKPQNRPMSPEWKKELWTKSLGCVGISAGLVLFCYLFCPLVADVIGFFSALLMLMMVLYLVLYTRKDTTGRFGYDNGLQEILILMWYSIRYVPILLVVISGVAMAYVTNEIKVTAARRAYQEEKEAEEKDNDKWAQKVRRPGQPAPKPGQPGPKPGKRNQPQQPPWTPPKAPPSAADFPGLVGYWTFDEANGIPADSSPGNVPTGLLHGSTRVKGIRGNAIQFNGQPSDYLELGRSPALNFAKNDAFTISGWVKSQDSTGVVFGFRNSRDPHRPLIRIWLESGVLNAWVRNDGETSAPVPGKGQHRFADGHWRHFAITRHPNGALDLYLDGESMGGMKGNAYVKPGGALTTDQRVLGGNPVWLNKRQGRPDGHFFNGALDEFCVFRRALAPAEIKRLAGR